MGLFINFEAIDSSGKREQAAALAAALAAAGYSVARLTLPDRPRNGESPEGFVQLSTGGLITDGLYGGLKLLEERDSLFRSGPLSGLTKDDRVAIASVIEEKIFQVLQSVNRRESVFRPGGLLEMLAGNDVVVVERMLSARAYGVARGVSVVEIDAIEGDLPKPDLSILLDTDPAVARASGSRAGYDENLPEIRRFYDLILREDQRAALDEGRLSRWLEVDASVPEESLTSTILAAVLARLPQRA